MRRLTVPQYQVSRANESTSRQFYALSKLHHPDHNPSDPSGAEKRFVKVSEAYATLGNATKRERYDRDVLRRHASPARPQGSHYSSSSSSSSGPAGGRPASGLSRRRTPFHGPPPSFYRSGAWGEHGEKRRRAQAQGASSSSPSASSSSSSSVADAGQAGAAAAAAAFEYDDPSVPHFDRRAHHRTQAEQDRRRGQRRAVQHDAHAPEVARGMLANFAFVTGVVAVAVLIPSMLFNSIVGRRRDTSLDKR